MKKLLIALSIVGFAAGQLLAAGPEVTFGPPGSPIQMGPRDGVCQYGFQDDLPGQGWSLYSGQQLGISCGPGTITSVGAYCEFIGRPGTVNVVILDNGTPVQSTPVQPVQGNNEWDIPDIQVNGTSCIMLCPTTFDGVTGEDMTHPPFGNTFFSNNCTCQYPFTDNNLTIWATFGNPTPVQEMSWGHIRMLYR